MRKLIEELQTEIERRDLKDAALEGLFLALQIVKAHNPWYPVTELPPSMDEDGVQISYLITHNGFHFVAYHNEVSWYNESDLEYIAMATDTDVHWTFLPEVTQ